jgi:hypothetical protein
VLDGRATLRPNSGMRQSGPRPTRSASYSERRHGFGSGVSAASITRRSLTLSRSSCGGRTLPAINYGLALAARVATAKERPSSIRAGPAIISASIRFRLKSPTRCATMILLASLSLKTRVIEGNCGSRAQSPALAAHGARSYLCDWSAMVGRDDPH